MKLLGVDVGGTFTDSIITDPENGQVWIQKTPTTVDDPSLGIINGIKKLCQKVGIDFKQIGYLIHGTTIATNSILEHEGAKTGMITTKNYRDIIHIARHQRPENYSIIQEIPWQEKPLVKRRYRKVVSERIIPPNGEVLLPMNEDEVRHAVRELKKEGIESIIVCFLFSYLNPVHERRAAEIIAEEHPEAYVTTSSDICPQFREYERFTTACLNGFVGIKVKRYLDNLSRLLTKNGIGGELHIMRSNGGVSTSASISEKPVTTLLSGPAAGIMGGSWVGNLSNNNNLITFDVGGTSADIGIVTPDGIAESTARDTWISGYPLMLPMLDVYTIGAGGGSIAYVDSGGAFRVGPKSAGANPGPACYNMGGKYATVTDANVVLGRLEPDYFLGGAMPIFPLLAKKAIENLADQLKIDLYETAEGVLSILNHNMAHAIRSKTVVRGHDPRKFTLVAFGGAGPLHAVETARILKIPKVLVPVYPGIMSAIGLLTTDLKYDSMKTEFMNSDHVNFKKLREDLRSLEKSAIRQLKKDGLEEVDILLYKTIDCRYHGQGYELRISVAEEDLNEERFGAFIERFHKAHQTEYGHSFINSQVELVNIRVTGIGRIPKITKVNVEYGSSVESALVKEGESYFRVNGNLEKFSTKIYNRFALPLNSEIMGPAVMLQEDTTTILPPDAVAVIEETGNMIIQLQ